MFRPTLRAIPCAPSSLKFGHHGKTARRLITTAPPHQTSRSWKSSAARWGIAGALVYYYNTSTAFAEEPAYVHSPPNASHETETYQTVASVAEQRRSQSRRDILPSQDQQKDSENVAVVPDGDAAVPNSPESLEEEASQEGAFNEETGEINWDCPCLGGMAHGPCGEQFRAAFSCFVFSKDEPKGIDCIEHFKTMQNCFREHPDIYGAELEDEDEPAPAERDGQPSQMEASAQPQSAQGHAAGSSNAQSSQKISSSDAGEPAGRSNETKEQ